MGFYGNITNTSNTTFQFDRIYPNRLSMDANVNNDGIFIGRYVLVEYERKAAYPVVYTKVVNNNLQFYSSPNCEDITRIKFGTGNDQIDQNDIVKSYPQGTNETTTDGGEWPTNTDDIKFYRCTGKNTNNYAIFVEITNENDVFGQKSDYILNYAIDENHYYPQDENERRTYKGYDSTVWTKISETSADGQLITKYVNIADLNSVVPTFDIVADAPTMVPITPHFDAESTNVYYKLHMQTPFGFRIRENTQQSDQTTTHYETVYDKNGNITSQNKRENVKADIFYNKNALEYKPNNKTNRVETEPRGLDEIKLTLGKSINYDTKYQHYTAGDVQGDIQELSIHLPSVGYMVSQGWDVIHGENRDDARTDDNDSLKGRLDSFKEIKTNQIPVKRANDGTLVGSKINNAVQYQLPNGKDILSADNIPNKFRGDDPWIETEIDTTDLVGGTKAGESNGIYDQTNNSGISIRHTFHGVKNSQTTLDKNSGDFLDKSDSDTELLQKNKLPVTNEDTENDDTIKLYTPYVDATGHVVGKNIETITLPYGYKTVKAKEQSVAVTNPNTNTEEVIADSTQDTLQFASSNKWIRMSGSNSGTGVNHDTFNIGHEVHSINEEKSDLGDIINNIKTSHTNLNSDDKGNDTEKNLTIYDWSYDEAGHIKEKREHTYTLPYSFKTINVGNNTTEDAAPTQTGVEGETADQTQDSLTFTPTNRWIKMVATGNNEIKFGHELSGIEAKEHSSSDTDIANFGDTFNILKFTTDKAGHITAVGEESVKIPSIVFTNDTAGNVVTNMSYSYNTNNKTGTFIETREDIGTLTLGTHTGTTITANGLDILSTDTMSGAFNKVQTHINNLILNPTENTTDWVTNVTQVNGQVAINKKGTDVLQLKNYSALTSVSSKDLSTSDTLNSAFGKLEYRIKDEEKNRIAAIEALDVTDAEDDTKYVSGVSETNGKIAVLRKGTDTLKLNNYTIATVSSDVANGDTINSAFGKIQKQIKDIYGNEEIATNFDTIKEIADWLAANDSNADKIIDSIATLNGNDTVSGSVANSIKTAIEGLGSAAFTDSISYATAAQGTLADNALPKNATFVYTPEKTDEETGEVTEAVSVTIAELVKKVADLENEIKQLKGE